MSKIALLGASLLAFHGAHHRIASVSDTQTITVVNNANVRPWVLKRVEQAVENQSAIVRSRWGTPLVRFGPGGWKLYLQYQIGRCATAANDAEGCHSYDATNTPYMVVATFGDSWSNDMPPQWSSTFDHETLEAIASDQGASEICDPVENDLYQANNGAMLSDFVYPNYFRIDASGPYDFLGYAHAPLSDPSGD